MSKNLVIVESPAKAKTIKKYLGKDFEVLASYGHVRDLVPKEGAVDPDHDFAMKYQIIEKNEHHVEAIAKAAAKAETLYLATDPDREGEAISWHLAEILRQRDLLQDKPVWRVVFHEVTQRAIVDAVAHPRDLSLDLVNAQQARRALDYLVGFNLSPLLWKKIRPGLSAGRVQSPALRMIVEREDEIERFQAQEYWTLEADAAKDRQPLLARLTEYSGEKLTQFSITQGEQAHAIEQTLRAAAQAQRVESGAAADASFVGRLRVAKVERKQRKRNPAAPFTTSTLQQEASRKLGFSTQRTMRLAQQLYEGIDTGSGAVGLITYMRTDSVNLAQDALNEIRALIAQRYGANNLPASPRLFKTKAKNAQEAHEAIRPTVVAVTPESIRAHLNADQYALYELIWKRTVACQMIPATLDTVAVDLACGTGNTFRATGSTVADPGFMAVYQEDVDDQAEEESRMLPPLKPGEWVDVLALRPEQHFTEPPPRYSEASLVKTLEEHGIGRPSTYATIISTLIAREYAVLDSRRFKPTDIGRIVSQFLTQHFNPYVDYEFTARLEDNLDAVSRGEEDWVPLMREFWDPFKQRVDEKTENVSRQDVVQSRELGMDPQTGKLVSVRMGRFGAFAQIGVKEDADKPRFASLRADQRLNTVTLDDALVLFQLPRDLGTTAEGEPIQANIGRFGPYVRYGKSYVSLKGVDPYTVSHEQALELIAAHREALANRIVQTFPDSPLQILNGRFGPYITDGQKNVRVPKDREPASLSLTECETLIREAPEKKKRVVSRRAATPAKATKATKAPKASKATKAPKALKASKATKATKATKASKVKAPAKVKQASAG